MSKKTQIKRVTKQAGLPGIEGTVKRVKGKGIEAGILAGTGEHPNATGGQTIAEIAFWNEFGTRQGKPGRIPPRPFLRLAVWKNRRKYRRQMRNLLKAILLGKLSAARAHGILGLEVQKDIQAEIDRVFSPPNAPATKEKKKSSKPLIDTGAMRQHISWGMIKRVL